MLSFGLQFYVGKYKFCSKLTKGQFFNNISDESIKEYNLYICKTNCDIGQITRQEFCEHQLNLPIKLKMKNTLKEIKNDFYFLKGINDEKFIQDYSHLLLYKKYKKGDKIFLQGGLYEGVYLVYDGEISLSSKINEITDKGVKTLQKIRQKQKRNSKKVLIKKMKSFLMKKKAFIVIMKI